MSLCCVPRQGAATSGHNPSSFTREGSLVRSQPRQSSSTVTPMNGSRNRSRPLNSLENSPGLDGVSQPNPALATKRASHIAKGVLADGDVRLIPAASDARGGRPVVEV